MLKFVLRRLAQMVIVAFVMSLLVFLWLKSLPGGTAQAMLGDRATPERLAALEKSLGLDRPLHEQYISFLGNALQGDFGASIRVEPGSEALSIFLNRLPATIELSAAALLIAITLGIPLGYLAARHRGRWIDNASVIATLIGVSIPVFFLAFLLKQIFAVQLGWLPVSGRQDPLIDATHVTNFFVLDGILTQEWDASWDAIKHLILPAIALSSIPLAVILRITRASVLGVVDEDYVRTAEAKGLTRKVIRSRHVMRNALIPVITTIGLQVGALLAGAVLTETVFAFRGVGDALATAARERDYTVLQVLLLAAALIYVVVNTIVDIAYAIIDPRVRTR